MLGNQRFKDLKKLEDLTRGDRSMIAGSELAPRFMIYLGKNRFQDAKTGNIITSVGLNGIKNKILLYDATKVKAA